MKYPKLRELGEAVKSLFSKPYTTKFPKVAHEGFDGFRGKPEFFDEYCVGCGACTQVCPAGAIAVIDPEIIRKDNKSAPKRKLELRYDMCNFCGNCEAHCITEKGVQLTKKYDLALMDRKLAVETIEKELVVCEMCGGTVTTIDHLRWLVKKLGTLAYGNPTLLLVSQRELIPVQSGRKGEELRRPDILKVMCPKCRHKVMVKDIWG
ncbi:MAG TPA: 4Fe-4S dicluster domain-containing protein [bacterium]|nr:4Fe-4S dicluster domain-containing protein [bacterium]